MENAAQDRFHVSADFFIRNAKHAKGAGANDLVAVPIFLLGSFVYRPIDFNHKSGCGTVEVNYVTINDLLSPETQARKSLRTKLLPKQCFLRSRVLA